LSFEERAVLQKLAANIQAGLRQTGQRAELEGALSSSEERTLVRMEEDLDRGLLGRPWPRIESEWLILLFGFTPRVSEVLRATWTASMPPGPRAPTASERSAHIQWASQFSEALHAGDLELALRVSDSSSLHSLHAVLPGGEARPRSGPLRIAIESGRPTEADTRVIRKIAAAIRMGSPDQASLRDVLQEEDLEGFRRVAQALDDGAWGFRWPRAEWRPPWQVLGFPVDASNALGAAQLRGRRALGADPDRVQKLIRLSQEFSAALDALDFARAEYICREMNMPFPAL
jgi:hypothetical protein